MTNIEKEAYNKAIDDCVKLTRREGFSHSAGLSQFVSNQFSILEDKIKALKL